MSLTISFLHYKYENKSKKYKYVSKYKRPDNIYIYLCTYRSKKINGQIFLSEKEAAIEVDLRLIKNNKTPINVLKPYKNKYNEKISNNTKN